MPVKRLTLIRHAKSSWKDSSLNDFERPLNKRGKRDGPEMGRRLANRGIHPDLIKTSPATRALTTANIIAGKIGYSSTELDVDKRLYTGSAAEILEVVQDIRGKYEDCFVVGHNPSITTLANKLTGEGIDNVPTCGIVRIEFDCDAWDGLGSMPGRLVFFDYPKKPFEE